MEELQAFRDYLLEKGYAQNTSYSYSNSINSISEHMSDLKGSDINIYNIQDIDRLIKIRDTYGLNGNHSEFGNKGNGTIRNAISRFVEFRENQGKHSEVSLGVVNEGDKTEELENYEDILCKLENIEREVSEIKGARNLLTILIASQVFITCLIIYILFQL